MTCPNTQDVVHTLYGSQCPTCGGELAASGVDGGSWVHFDSRKPDRVAVDHYYRGRLILRVLANGVKIRPKDAYQYRGSTR